MKIADKVINQGFYLNRITLIIRPAKWYPMPVTLRLPVLEKHLS
jgi:hypothetical protein